MTTLAKIKKIADENDVRFSVDMDGEDCEGKKMRRIGLHGFLANIQSVERQISGYDITQSTSGHYLTRA
jgi:hypothetical protein